MSHCYNCGCEISADEKTRLCDRCKQILLPFIKFMDASTSSAVRRLVSNEKNLRNAGVTDRGMEYLLRICELHDRSKMREREEREAAKTAGASVPRHDPPVPEDAPLPDPGYSEIELPLDEPLDLHRTPYGKFLPIVMVLLILLGTAALLCEIVLGGLSIPVILCAVGLILAGYAVHILRILLHDLGEIKKHFR